MGRRSRRRSNRRYDDEEQEMEPFDIEPLFPAIIEITGYYYVFSEEPPPAVEMKRLTDVFREGDELVVVTELPDASKDSINTYVSQDGYQLVIRIKNKRDRYHRVSLPVKVDKVKSVKYNNGVLEVRLQVKK